jgi:hypothetical protein
VFEPIQPSIIVPVMDPHNGLCEVALEAFFSRFRKFMHSTSSSCHPDTKSDEWNATVISIQGFIKDAFTPSAPHSNPDQAAMAAVYYVKQLIQKIVPAEFATARGFPGDPEPIATPEISSTAEQTGLSRVLQQSFGIQQLMTTQMVQQRRDGTRGDAREHGTKRH